MDTNTPQVAEILTHHNESGRLSSVDLHNEQPCAVPGGGALLSAPGTGYPDVAPFFVDFLPAGALAFALVWRTFLNFPEGVMTSTSRNSCSARSLTCDKWRSSLRSPQSSCG